jgi:hypothetical protein
MVQSQPRQIVHKMHHQKGLAEWLKWQGNLPCKCEALSSNSNAAKKKVFWVGGWTTECKMDVEVLLPSDQEPWP